MTGAGGVRRFQVEDFEFGRLLGAGTFGRVHLCSHKLTGEVFALKCLSKSQCIKTGQVGAQKSPSLAVRDAPVMDLGTTKIVTSWSMSFLWSLL